MMTQLKTGKRSHTHMAGLRLAALLLSVAIPALAETDSVTDPQNCSACHTEHALFGVHAGALFGPSNLVADCADCHRRVTNLSEHERGAADVIRFGRTDSAIETANDQCLNCHEPMQLRVAHWTHDAHGDDLACARCHQLHPKNDPVRGLSQRATIRLCVDCHRDPTRSEGE